jgi:DNA replication and repair protein RecF
MKLNNLRLLNFKNYSDCELNFNSRFNFLYGDNGNGKTNILEAVSILCYTKSFLQSAESDCVKYGENSLEVTGRFLNRADITNNVVLEFDKTSSRKSITLNGEPIGRQTSFFGKIPLVTLTPGDIKLTLGTPADRRRSFDMLISQTSRIYFDDLRNFNRVVKQKNTLLKENYVQKKYPVSKLKEMIELWNDELVGFGVKVILKRLEVVSEFQRYIEENFKKIVGDYYIPAIIYESDLLQPDPGELTADELKKVFKKILEEKFRHELRRGVSMTGPHRDNYRLLMKKNGNRFDMRYFASQGEHKTFLIALRLAEYFYLKDKLEGSTSGDPILLLDDIYSELDKNRAGKISAMLPEFNQVFLTTTDKGYLNMIGKFYPENEITGFHIVNGTAQTTD